MKTYDALELTTLANTYIVIKEGSDYLLANQTSPVLRNESTNEIGEFKFLKLAPTFYSFYGYKSDYYYDAFSIPVIGTYTPTVPYLYLLP